MPRFNLQKDTDCSPELGGGELKGVDVSVVRASSSKGTAQVTENQLGVSVSVALAEAGFVLEVLFKLIAMFVSLSTRWAINR